jgi:hypothetical protein
MEKYAIGLDGFVEYNRKYTLENAIACWKKTITNRWLYQHDVSIYEVDDNNKIIRRLSHEEIIKEEDPTT